MARAFPFPGVRYNPDLMPDLGQVIAPPYDVISPDLQSRLYSRSLQNVVRVELGLRYPDDIPGERDQYTRARDHLRAWLDQRVLVGDEPSVYVHSHRFVLPGGGEGERRGLFTALEPVPYQRGEVLRHERTLSAPRQDRLNLLRATGMQTSPVFLLYEAGEEATEALAMAEQTAELVGTGAVEGDYGLEQHRLWRVGAGELQERIRRGLGRSRLFIADGHHRYETAVNLHLPRVLALLAPLAADEVVLPTHRLLSNSPRAVHELAATLADGGWLVEYPESLEQGQARLSELQAQRHAFVVVGADGLLLISRPRSESGAPSQRLDVAVLEAEVLMPYLGIGEGETAGGRLSYTRDAAEAAQSARASGGLAFLLNPTLVEELAAVAAAGESMPQKSTYFYPKVPAGLVMMPVD